MVINLSNQELFFPEKRPFFNQGLELFQPVAAEYGQQPMQLFYSRRIGLDTPILAAAKVTGSGWKGLDIGILDAVVMGAPDPGKKDVAYLDDPDPDDAWVHQVEGNPDKRLQFHSQQPLHIGLNSALPREPPVSRNYFAAVARQTFLGNSSVGLTLTSVNPFSARCTAADIERQSALQAQQPLWVQVNSTDPIAIQDCQAYGGNTAGLDFNLRSRTGEWVAMGTVVGTRRIGGPADDVLFDGTVMHPGDFGGGGYLVAGKLGGEGFRFNVNVRYRRRGWTSTPWLPAEPEPAGLRRNPLPQERDIGSLHELQSTLYANPF